MGKKSDKRLLSEAPAEIQVFIDFEVTITEVHVRTGTVCDKKMDRFNFEFGTDFPNAAYWLESDHAEAAIGSFSNEIHDRWAAKSGGKS